MQNNIVNNKNDQNTYTFSWGEITWLIDKKGMPEAENAFGVTMIKPGMSNPLHIHPNCEEIMYIVSGECDCKVGDEIFHLTSGSVIRIPSGVEHNAKCTGNEPVHTVISFSVLDRKTISLDESNEYA